MATQTTKTRPAKRGLAHRLYTGDISYDFVGLRKRWYVMSGVILGVALLALLLRGLSLGIEFSGGADFQAPTRVTATTVDDMRAAIADSGVPDLDDTTVTTLGDNTVRVQTRSLDPETEVPIIRQVIADEVGAPSDQVAYSLIGASWGQQITQQGLIALGVFLVLVMLMIWIYFRDLKMSVAAIVALLHDLLLTIGIYALVGFTFTPATLIGMLTILGYSLYDTVVVFDKVRENVKDLDTKPYTYAYAANLATNQVLIRSINTTIIGVLPVAALLTAGWFILGTGPLKDLGLVMFVGMVAGAYSSVLIATPLLVDLKLREPGIKAHTAAGERGAIGPAAPRTAASRGESRTESPTELQAESPAESDAEAEQPEEKTEGTPLITSSTTNPVPPPPRGVRQQPRHQSRSERKK